MDKTVISNLTHSLNKFKNSFNSETKGVSQEDKIRCLVKLTNRIGRKLAEMIDNQPKSIKLNILELTNKVSSKQSGGAGEIVAAQNNNTLLTIEDIEKNILKTINNCTQENPERAMRLLSQYRAGVLEETAVEYSKVLVEERKNTRRRKNVKEVTNYMVHSVIVVISCAFSVFMTRFKAKTINAPKDFASGALHATLDMTASLYSKIPSFWGTTTENKEEQIDNDNWMTDMFNENEYIKSMGTWLTEYGDNMWWISFILWFCLMLGLLEIIYLTTHGFSFLGFSFGNRQSNKQATAGEKALMGVVARMQPQITNNSQPLGIVELVEGKRTRKSTKKSKRIKKKSKRIKKKSKRPKKKSKKSKK